MIKRLLDQVRDTLATETTETDREPAIRLATAVLLADVAQADDVFDEAEFDRVLRLMESHFQLQPEDAAELVNQATEEAEGLVSLHAFTDILHENLSEDEKAGVVRLLWNVAYADGNLDKYEDSLVLKISDLLHVSRGRVMRLKHDANPAT
ncbi:MAG: TerB family tellurite resistance protein [Pseudomonadota bacterium]